MTAEELRAHDRRLAVLAHVLVVRCSMGGRMPRPYADADELLKEVQLQTEAIRDAVYWRDMTLLHRALVRMAAVSLMFLEDGYPAGRPPEDEDYLRRAAVGYAPTVF